MCDLNGDGKADLVITKTGGNTVTVVVSKSTRLCFTSLPSMVYCEESVRIRKASCCDAGRQKIGP
jgi:hypothetical protein